MRRKEDPRLITGRARYVDDIVLTGQLLRRRSSARPRRTRRSSRSTRRRPRRRDGVVAVYTGEDIDDLAAPLPMAWVPPGVEVNTPEHWPLAKGKVKHVGDPVAVVVGDDRYARRRRRRGRPRRVRAAARRHRPRGGARGRRAARPRAVRHEQGARVVARRRRPRGRLRRGRRRSSSAGSSTTASPARRSSRAPCSPSTAPAT